MKSREIYTSWWKLFQKRKFNRRTYQIQELKLNNGDWVFMYSDGYYDQFGGPKNKSMGSIKFKKYYQILLKKIS